MRVSASLFVLFCFICSKSWAAGWDSSIWDEAVWDQAAALYEVQASATDGGSIEPEGIIKAAENEVLTFTVSAEGGYQLSTVESSCGGGLNSNVFTTSPITGDCSVNAKFVVIPPPSEQYFNITLSSNPGGSVAPATPIRVLEGETQYFSISLNPNYEVRSVVGDCVASFNNTGIQTSAITDDCSITVTFGLISGTVPPSQPTISMSEASSNSISFAIDVADQGSDPIIDYTATCEIPPPPQKNATQNLESQLIGELVNLGKSQVGTPVSTGVYGLDLRLDLRDTEIGDRLGFPASGGQIISLVIDQRDVTKFGNIRLRGGDGENSFDLMIAPHGAVIGEYFDGKTSVEIRPTPRGQRLYVGSEGGITSINDDFAIATPPVSKLSKGGVLAPSGQGVISEDFYVVSLLIMVDQVIQDSGNKYLFADYYVTTANTAYLDSGVRVVLSLLDVVLNQPSTSNQNQAGILEEITCGAAGCDYNNDDRYNEAINSLRESYKADLVAQMVSFAEEPLGGGPICGIATLPFGELYNPDTFATDLRYRYSYSVIALGVQSTDQICPRVLLAHEIGHNMGLLHDAAQSPSLSPLVSGGRGFVLGDGLRGTVMAYPPAGIFTGYVNLFSDPDRFVDGWRLGTTLAPYPADSTNALNVVAPFYANIFSNTNEELIPASPELLSVSQRGTLADVFFNEVGAPVGTPVDANLDRRLLYLADCGNNGAQLGYGSPISISGLERGRSHSCVVYAVTDYAASSASNSKSIFMEKLSYTIQADAGTGGEISPVGSVRVEEGQDISFYLTPSEGYRLNTSIGGTCEGTLDGQTYTVENVQANCSIAASFIEIKPEYVVTPSVTLGGSIEPSSPQMVMEGDVISFEMTPEDGYSIGPVGGSCGGSTSGAIYTTQEITSDCSVEFTFEQSPPAEALITLNLEGEGSVSPALPVTVPIGDALSLTLSPDENYRLIEVNGCDGLLTGQIYEIPKVVADCVVNVRFSQFRWTVVSQSPQITFDQLPPDTAFECSVSARNQAGESSSAALYDIQTLPLNADSDGDGVPDDEDAFPNDPNETTDSDGDGVGNNEDTDDDNDGVLDGDDYAPLDPDVTEQPADEALTVYVDGTVGSEWDRGINAFDQALNWGDCSSSDDCTSIAWETVSDADRGDVLQITHANNGNLAGLYFASTTGVDLTDYGNGAIEFDIKVVSGDANITMRLDCFYPCFSGEQLLGEKGVNGWESVSVSMSGLNAGGLDLSNVNTGLVIWATKFQDTVFQIDNVRFTVYDAGDSDGDGVADSEDAFPNDPNETTDSDGDGVGNNEDTDDDNDGFTDIDELEEGSDPLDASSQPEEIGGLSIIVFKAAIDAAKAINP